MKLTPPAPQNPLRRMKFFVEHQDDPKFPNAREEALKMSRIMNASQRPRKFKKQEITLVKEAEVRKDMALKQELSQVKKANFLEKIVHKIKKASQRGN